MGRRRRYNLGGWRGDRRRDVHVGPRHHDPGDKVSNDRERNRKNNGQDPNQAHDRGIHSPVFGEAATDSAQLGIRHRARQPPWRSYWHVSRHCLARAADVAKIGAIRYISLAVSAIHFAPRCPDRACSLPRRAGKFHHHSNYVAAAWKVPSTSSPVPAPLIRHYLPDRIGNAGSLRQDFVFELRLVGTVDVQSSHSAHGRVQIVKEFAGNTRGNFRAVAPR